MTTSHRFDLIVIGGGPAGTAAAITAARRGARVVLLEAGSYPRQKVCGEFVSPEALASLQQLLACEDYDRLTTGAPIIAMVSIHVENLPAVALAFSPAARSISRHALDSQLWEAAIQAGVACRARTIARSIDRESGMTIVTCGENRFVAAHIILATGRWSNLPRRPAPERGDLWLGLKGHFHDPAPTEACDLYFFPEGYCGIQPAGGGRVNVAAMVRSGVATSLREVFSLHKDLGVRAAQWQAAFTPISCAPLVHNAPAPQLEDMLLTGDAAGFIDPFVGDGIAIALRTGQMAAEAVCSMPELAGDLYSEQYRRNIMPAFRNAASLRTLTGTNRTFQRVALAALRLGAVQRRVISATRLAV